MRSVTKQRIKNHTTLFDSMFLEYCAQNFMIIPIYKKQNHCTYISSMGQSIYKSYMCPAILI